MAAIEKTNDALEVPHVRGTTDLLDYYSDAGPDYAAWSTNFNMHFGLWSSPLDVFRRERMLDQMSAAVLARLELGEERTMVVDLGCGLGATMRWAAHHYQDTWFVGGHDR